MHVLGPYLKQLTNLKELSLEENNITIMPNNIHEFLPVLVNLNLNGNEILDEEFEQVVQSL